jgi:hypothetical protein
MSNPGDLADIAQAVTNILTAKTRGLTGAEIKEAKAVFQDTIDYDNVWIADKTGKEDRAFTLWAGVLTATSLRYGDKYVLFMGPDLFKDMSGDWHTFIHELTHVWQGQNHYIHAGYMLNSLIAQGIEGSDEAYEYKNKLGGLWSNFNAEQQAHLVEDWYYLDKKAPSGPRYIYVRDYIRHPRRSWLIETALDLV